MGTRKLWALLPNKNEWIVVAKDIDAPEHNEFSKKFHAENPNAHTTIQKTKPTKNSWAQKHVNKLKNA